MRKLAGLADNIKYRTNAEQILHDWNTRTKQAIFMTLLKDLLNERCAVFESTAKCKMQAINYKVVQKLFRRARARFISWMKK